MDVLVGWQEVWIPGRRSGLGWICRVAFCGDLEKSGRRDRDGTLFRSVLIFSEWCRERSDGMKVSRLKALLCDAFFDYAD